MKISSLVFTGVFAALSGFALASIAPAYAQLSLCQRERQWCMTRFCPAPQ